MKKICMVAYTNYLSDARPRREAETLARRGDKVDFISLGEQGRPQQETVDGVRLFRTGMRRYRGASGAAYLFSYLRFFCAASCKLLGLFLRERYDVVYVHTMPDLMVFVGLLPKLLGARVVLNVHDMMPELYMSKFAIGSEHPLIRLLALQEQLSIRFADAVICVHDPHRDVLCARGARREKIVVIPNVPDPRIVANKETAGKADSESFRIVYHGTVAKRLGLDLAVVAFEKIADACPKARLEIFGDGDAGEALAAQIAASPYRERIYFSQKLFPVYAVAEMVSGAALGVIPNRMDVATNYMLPVKLLEYVHLGIPAIAPRLLAIQYYFKEEMLEYYEAGEVEELAAAMARLYADPERRASLARKCLEFAKVFTWSEFQKDLFRVVDGAA